MKKTLLTLAGALLVSSAAFAQISQTQCSGNIITSDEGGYALNFNSSQENNCFANGGVGFYAPVPNQSWAIDGTGNLVVTVPTMTAYDDTRQAIRFYKDGCGAQPIDLSGTGNNKFSIGITSNAASNREIVVVFYSGTQTNFNVTLGHTVAPGHSVITASGVDLTGIDDASTITSIGIFFRGGTGWGDFDAAGTYTIDYIYVGDADASTAPTPPTDCGTVTATTSANVVNDQVAVFPNPAKGAFTVDMTAMNNSESALVTILNANGNIVKEFSATTATPSVATEGLVKGIYMVKITSGNKVATKKVVVE